MTAESHIPDFRARAAVLMELAQQSRAGDLPAALELAREARALEPTDDKAIWLSLASFEAGNISEPARLLEGLEPGSPLTGYEARMRRQIEGWNRLLHRTPEIPSRQLPAYEPKRRTALYVSAACQPFHFTGYTVRTHELLQAASRTPWRVLCMARPGYPWDRWDALERPSASCARQDGIEYQLTAGTSISATPPDRYLSGSAALIESAARRMRPAVMHAASNHMTALPSLIAARRLGIPFVYEVRGLWEIFFGLGKRGWKESERFLLARRLESMAAREADAVLTLTSQLSEELQARGVAPSRIRLLPNGGNPDLRNSTPRDRSLIGSLGLDASVFTIGYAGALKSYEGLDDLLESMAELHRAGRRVQAVVVGDGDQLPFLRAREAELGLDETVRFTGRMPPAAARAHLRAVDVAVLPRKRVEVSEMVSPLKPFEIMALEVPLIMSNVRALADIAEDSRGACLLFEASNPRSLASQLERFMDDPVLRSTLAASGRDFVANRRSWELVVRTMVSTYDELEAAVNTPGKKLARRASLALRFMGRGFRRRAGPTPDHVLIEASGLFDAGWYRRRYPGVTGDPIEDYIRHGAKAGRDPGPEFDTQWYLESNPDVARSAINPLVHYLLHGRNEGRAPKAMRDHLSLGTRVL
jgi:glycosyltransferase involved in cell wall biosynthesis